MIILPNAGARSSCFKVINFILHDKMYGLSSHCLYLVESRAKSVAFHVHPKRQDVNTESFFFYLQMLKKKFVTFLRHLKRSNTLGHRTADVTGVSCTTIDPVIKEKLGHFRHQRRLWNVQVLRWV